MRLRLGWLIAMCAAALPAATLHGFVSDPSGSRVPNARINLLDGSRVAATTTSVISGAFELTEVAPGDYILRVAANGFVEYSAPVRVTRAAGDEVQVVLPAVSPQRSDVTVIARRGSVDDAQLTPQVALSGTKEELGLRGLQTTAHALDRNPDVTVQETTAGESSPILRGLTGYQTLLLIDGVRLNTSIFRSGPNQYLSFIHPNQADRVEALLGPSGASYGSDSLGGTINVTTASPRLVEGRRLPSGELSVIGGTADLAGGWSSRISGRYGRWAYGLGGFTQRNGTLRTGGAIDSRNSFRRYFDLPPSAITSLIGDRLPATDSSRNGAHGRANWRVTPSQSLTFWYQHDELSGVRSYRDQLGGPGNLISRMTPQALDFGYGRYEKLRLGPLDVVSATFSANSQQDGSVKQALRPTDTVTTDRNVVLALGYAIQATGHIGGRQAFVVGSEVYRESVDSSRFAFDPVGSKTTQQRAQYPDGSVYTTSAVFAQDTLEVIPARLRVTAGLRYSWIRFASFADRNRDGAGNLLGVSDSRRSFSDLTFHTASSLQITRSFALHAVIARGFRAPNMNDLGSVGMGTTTLGFEIPAEIVAPLGAQFAADSSDTSGSSGKYVGTLQAESLDSYEGGVTWRTGPVYARAQFFDAELLDPISGRTILFPADSVPSSIGGIAVTPLAQSAVQRQQGVYAVVTSLSPRAVKTTVNDGHTRYYGTEGILETKLGTGWSAGINYSFLVGRDLNPNRTVRRLPPQQAAATVRYIPPSRRIWLEFAAQVAGAQERLNGGDIDDDRIGASRRRSDIAAFFNGGVAAPWIVPGADGARGTADDIFSPTGETLLRIQNRVLPLGSTINGVKVTGDGIRVPLFVRNAGWASFSIRGGAPLSRRLSVSFGVGNLFDRNYRVYGSGVDAPGRGALLILKYSF